MLEIIQGPVPQLPNQPWSLSNCVNLNQRDQLAAFWLAAPEDLLPSLWSSPIGEATKAMVRSLKQDTIFSPEQVSLRNAIGERLSAGLKAPMATQLLLANFLYSPPGLLQIADAGAQLPAWLLADYRSLYEQTVTTASTQQQVPPATELPQPDFGVFPSTLQELLGNRVQLNRLLGLSNLYYIDPEDQEILQELRQVRMCLIEAIERCPEHDLQGIWEADLGDRYWALVRSGIQKEPMTPIEEQKKHSVTQKLNPSSGGGFGTPGATNAMLIAMMLFEPGSMRVSDAEQKLPTWLLPSYQQIFAQPLAQKA